MITRDAPSEFARVISCTACTVNTSSKLLRDAGENVPQPGYIGQQYDKTRLVLSGQNPGVCPSRFARQDAEYTKALRDIQSDPTPQSMKTLTEVLGRFVPQWPIHGNYFPLAQCGLGLSHVVYFLKRPISHQYLTRITARPTRTRADAPHNARVGKRAPVAGNVRLRSNHE